MGERYQDYCRRVSERAAKEQRSPTRGSALLAVVVVMAFAIAAAAAGRWVA